jgi:hypothetical protein
MRQSTTLSPGILVAIVLALVFAAPGGASADDCVALGGALAGGECVVSAAVTVSPKASPPAPADEICAFTLDETLRIANGGRLTIPPACTATVRPPFVPAAGAASTPGFKLVVTAGDFHMEAGSAIVGDMSAGHAGDIEVVVQTGRILLDAEAPQPGPAGAIIQSNRSGTCTGGSRGGNITLDAQAPQVSRVTQGKGSKIDSIAPCGRGEISILAAFVTLDGEVLSQGTTTQGRGGPITVNAGCDLKVTGSVVSLGRDPGADLVHLQGGCDVKIWGLVASTGPGHFFSSNPPHRCEPPNRPGKPENSDACVEVWSGGAIEIDSLNHNGEVHADTGTSGGTQGLGWIELFAKKNVTIIGDSAGPFSVHANQTLGNGHGGLINVKSTDGKVLLSGLAIQANDTSSGSSGGRPAVTAKCTTAPCGGITIEAKTDVDFSPDGRVEAKGATSGGGSQHGGQIDVVAFNGAILAGNNSKLDVTGDTPPDGVVNLTACTTPMAAFPPGQVVPVTPTKNSGAAFCGGTPALPTYPAVSAVPGLPPLPTCQCGPNLGCACATDFTPASIASIVAANEVTINGVNLLTVAEVWFSHDCNLPGVATQKGLIKSGGTDATIKVSPAAALLNAGDHIILVTPSGTCCTSATLIP